MRSLAQPNYKKLKINKIFKKELCKKCYKLYKNKSNLNKICNICKEKLKNKYI